MAWKRWHIVFIVISLFDDHMRQKSYQGSHGIYCPCNKPGKSHSLAIAVYIVQKQPNNQEEYENYSVNQRRGYRAFHMKATIMNHVCYLFFSSMHQ